MKHETNTTIKLENSIRSFNCSAQTITKCSICHFEKERIQEGIGIDQLNWDHSITLNYIRENTLMTPLTYETAQKSRTTK